MISGLRTPAVIALNVCLGLLTGILIHYFLYRISLPITPFIYVSF